MSTERTGNRGDFVLGGCATLLAVGYLVETSRIAGSAATAADSDAGLTVFPYILGVTLLVLGLVLTVLQIPRMRHGVPAPETTDAGQGAEKVQSPDRPDEPRSNEPRDRPSAWRRYRHVIMLAAAVAYVVLMTILGFLPAMVLFVACGVFVVAEPGAYRGRRILVPLLFGGVASLGCDLLFSEVLSMNLPPGVLGIGGF